MKQLIGRHKSSMPCPLTCLSIDVIALNYVVFVYSIFKRYRVQEHLTKCSACIHMQCIRASEVCFHDNNHYALCLPDSLQMVGVAIKKVSRFVYNSSDNLS